MDAFLNHASFSSSNASSNCCSIHGQILDVTVVAGNRLKNTERFSKQDPYVYVEYGASQKRTKTCKDGGINPIFYDKFQFELMEGLHKLTVRVLYCNKFTPHKFIGSGTVYLDEVLLKGCEEYSCNLLGEDNRSAGEIRLILQYPNALKPETKCVPSPPPPAPFQPPPCAQPLFYQAPPPQYHPPYQPPQYPPPTYPCYEPPPPPPAQSAYPPPPPIYPPPPASSPHVTPPSPGPFHGSYPPPPPPQYY